jgi:hypothetical protein
MSGGLEWVVGIWGYALRKCFCHIDLVYQDGMDGTFADDSFDRPSLMGAHTGPKIADAPLQARVVDTILVNATAIFDED